MIGRVAGRLAASMAGLVFTFGVASAHDAMFVEQGGLRMIKLNAPATDVIVADPSVVDVSVQTQNQLVLIGKKYGTTQLIILSGDAVLLDSEVVVSTANQNSSVSVFSSSGKGAINERSFTCYKRCATAQLVSSAESAAGQAITVTVGEGGAAAAAPAAAGGAPAAATTQ